MIEGATIRRPSRESPAWAGMAEVGGRFAYLVPSIVLLWVPVGLAVWARLPGTAEVERAIPMLKIMLLGGLVPLLAAAGWARLRARTLPGAVHLLWEQGWLGERLGRHVAFSVTLSAFFWAFACWKATIPLVHPFSWDATLALLDATFHGGRPDALLAPVFGSPRALIALDGLYECWAYVMFLLVLWQAWQPNRERCARFFLAFGLTWIVLGILGATVFSSAGPCYANGPGGGRLYSELFARLHAADAVSPLMALKGQAYLWTAHVRGLVPQGSGISAFPSLHVATAVLAALAVSESSKALGALAWLYVGLVWVASVMLGWHYAVDGEAALLAVIVCWQMAGFLTSVLPHEDVPRVPAWRFQDTFADAHPARADTPGPVRSRSWTFWP